MPQSFAPQSLASHVPVMSSFGVRPCFEHTVDLRPEATRARLRQSFARQSAVFEVRDFPRFIGLHIVENERRFWSPRLFLVLDATNEGATLVQGTYGPEMEIWSVFLYGYLITGMLGIFSGVLGFSQMMIKTDPWGLWVLGSMALLAALLYLSGRLGQKFGARQTFQLHQAYHAAMGDATDPDPN